MLIEINFIDYIYFCLNYKIPFSRFSKNIVSQINFTNRWVLVPEQARQDHFRDMAEIEKQQE